MGDKKFEYSYRPRYGSENYLLEFFISRDEKKFFHETLLDAIREIAPKNIGTEGHFLEDGVNLNFDSLRGPFSIFRDIWGFVFIESEPNQLCLVEIDKLLRADSRFEKLEVNPDDYKLSKNGSDKKA